VEAREIVGPSVEPQARCFSSRASRRIVGQHVSLIIRPKQFFTAPFQEHRRDRAHVVAQAVKVDAWVMAQFSAMVYQYALDRHEHA
jgi:hypothetical protein